MPYTVGDMSHRVAVLRSFIARHALIGGDWGAENTEHAHAYRAELILEGGELDRHGYLVDIVDVEAVLDGIVARYKDAMLNDCPAFAGINPSIEHFSRIIAEGFVAGLRQRERLGKTSCVTVRLWEHDEAWASYALAIEDV